MRVRASNVKLRGHIWSLAHSEEEGPRKGAQSTQHGPGDPHLMHWNMALRSPEWTSMLASSPGRSETRGRCTCVLLIIFREAPALSSSLSCVLHSHPSTTTLFFCSLCVSFVPTLQMEERPVSSVPGDGRLQAQHHPDFPVKNCPTPLLGDKSQGPVHLLPLTGYLLSSVFLFLQGVLQTGRHGVINNPCACCNNGNCDVGVDSHCSLGPWRL